MAHGPDTEELLTRIANVQNGALNLSSLNITSLPELPCELQGLWCSYTHLTSLPDLPSGLTVLECFNTPLTTLPELPSHLEWLWCANTRITCLPTLPSRLRVMDCSNTQLTSLPDLPPSLNWLNCSNTQLTSLPDLHSGLQRLLCSKTPLTLQRGDGEPIADYNARWRVWREEEASKKRCHERSLAIKENLVAECWRPERVEKLLEAGWDLVEAL
jgi:Leucine-rich repeat (LRR) protein